MAKQLCLFADVYGFSAMVLENDPDELSSRLRGFHKGISEILKRREKQTFKLIQFSDSIFLTKAAGERNFLSNLESFLNVCLEIYSLSMTHRFPLRGCITYGDLRVTNSAIIGGALLQAYSIEKDIGLPLIILPGFTVHSFPNKFQQAIWKYLAEPIDLRLRDGIISAVPILPSADLKVKNYAEERYIELAQSFGKERPAGAWKKLLQVIENRIDKDQ